MENADGIIKYSNIRDLAARAENRFRDTGFFLCNDERMPQITGAELLDYCSKAWGALNEYPTGHIALLGPASAAWVAAYFAVVSAGRVIVPLHDGMQEQALRAVNL